MGRLYSTGFLGDARAVASHLRGAPLPEAVTDNDIWRCLSTALDRPVLLLEDEQEGALGHLFRPGSVAEEQIALQLHHTTDTGLLEKAVIVLRRSASDYEPLRFVPQGQKKRTVGLSDLRRVARRGGVKRLGTAVAVDVQQVLRKYLREVLHDSIVVAEYNRRRTLMIGDVLHALHRRGTPMYR